MNYIHSLRRACEFLLLPQVSLTALVAASSGNVERSGKYARRDQEKLRDVLEKKIDNVEDKINSVEERIAVKMEEKIAVVLREEIEDLEKKLQAWGNTKNESKFVPVSSVPVLASPVPLTASPVSVKLSTYDGKKNWEGVYKTQFSIISKANGWTEGVKAWQQAASLRGEAAEILQTLPDTKRLNLNSLYNALDLGSARNTPRTTHVCK
ncbi:uncharacterized protein TNCV_4137991 [Trichonephila clavipes]|nr:uncharacterized protein TNCV_4137991 [Trichonephila clavipes]